MALHVLVVPDKFKGTLTARQATEAIGRGWSAARPGDTIELLPMSDGGDGFGDILGEILGAEPIMTRTVDAAHRPTESVWWWHAPTATAIIESASVIGLAMLPPGKYHPFELDTEGLGAVFKAAAGRGAKRCLVGIGGSATNDGGFGLARSLGWQFFNAHRDVISRWTGLHDLVAVRPPEQMSLFEDFQVAVDVRNPLLGPEGCSRIYGPQKGLTEFELAERCLGQLSGVLEKQLQLRHAEEPGAGAAGGLGFGLRCFAGARLEPGFALFARFARLEERLRRAQLVLTGEGALDASTLMGKGVGAIAQLCKSAGVPCIGLAGVVTDAARNAAEFTAVHALTPEFASAGESMREPAVWLERLAAKAGAEWSPSLR